MGTKRLWLAGLILAATAGRANATAEICGNAVDDDGNGMVDEGCNPELTTGVCESPLSCGETGMISWSTGSLHYDLPADIAPRVPYGPGMGFRRFYTSMYAPPTAGIPNINAKPMGDRWQHTYMTWVTAGATNQLILHTSQGRDVLFTGGTTSGGWKSYTPQAGYHVTSFKQNTVSPFQVQMQTLTGETITYNNSGQLTTITDLVGNAVAVTSDASGGTSTVTDASGKRRLLFGYTSGLLTTVKFQLNVSGTWTTYHTTTLAYSSGVLMSATIGSQLAQQYTYSAEHYLTAVTDGAGLNIAAFAYSGTTAGRLLRVDNTHGSLGFDFAPTRTGCNAAGQTLLLFNKLNSTTCSVDSDCGTGGMCGGKTGSGSTGACYSAARCLTLGSANLESVVTTVAPIGAGGGACTGACAQVMAYSWDTTSGNINATSTKDRVSRYVSVQYNTDGLPTTIVEGDTDTDATNTLPAGGRASYFFYDLTYRGRVKEVRRASDLSGSKASCSAVSYTGCARSLSDFHTTAPYLLNNTYQLGTTLDSTGATVPYNYGTSYTFDAFGRLTEVDGALAGAKTTYEYNSSTDPITNGFLHKLARYYSATDHLDQTISAYDFFGHPSATHDANNQYRCDTYDASRGYLTQTRYAMANQTDCTTVDGADLTTNWIRDSALRLTRLQRPDLSCVLGSYNSSGRLYQVKRRDDCLAGSAGDMEQYTYSSDGLVTEVDTYDSSSAITRKKLYSYANGRQLSQVINPVNPTYFTGLSYDASGQLVEVDGENSIGKTMYGYGPGNDLRVTSQTEYYSGTGSDSWTFSQDFDGDQTSYTDGDVKTVTTTRDDLGRVVSLVSPDFAAGFSNRMVYNADNTLQSKQELNASTVYLTSTYTYDLLGRRLTLTYTPAYARLWSVCSSTNAYTTWTYDALTTCPTGATCTNQNGRLSYVTTSLMCDGSSDNSLDQQTTYGYDAKGRLTSEYITDDTAMRTASHQFAYTKNGALSQVILPSSAVIGWSYGSTGNNSDADRITSVFRSTTATPVVDTVSWFPFGPLKQYNHENTSSYGTLERTRISRNLAYGVTDIRTETQDGLHELFGLALTEDVKGRITARDYADNSYGVQDSYFTYDNEDRLLCETTNSVASCPTSAASNIKNSHYQSPPFTHSGDWKGILRPIPGASTMVNLISLASGTHQISQIDQTGSGLGTTTYTYDVRGNRATETNSALPHGERNFSYDARGNVVDVSGEGGYTHIVLGHPFVTWFTYDVTSAFDSQNRRVFKQYSDSRGFTSQWYFYYDPMGRLSEVRQIPDGNTPSNYTMFQLVWLQDRMVSYYQTDYPAATTTRSFTGTDETGRILELVSWPSTGAGTRTWAVNPSAWAYDQYVVGGAWIFQPLEFRGQYMDQETAAFEGNASTFARPPVVLNGYRLYDPFTGGYVQSDPSLPDTRSDYIYANSDPVVNSDSDGRDYVSNPDGSLSYCGEYPDGTSSTIIIDDPTTGGTIESEQENMSGFCLDVGIASPPSSGGNGSPPGSGTPTGPGGGHQTPQDFSDCASVASAELEECCQEALVNVAADCDKYRSGAYGRRSNVLRNMCRRMAKDAWYECRKSVDPDEPIPDPEPVEVKGKGWVDFFGIVALPWTSWLSNFGPRFSNAGNFIIWIHPTSNTPPSAFR